MSEKTKGIILEVCDLHKNYGDTAILKNLNLTVRKSEAVVILGASGSGKSTLLRCLNGLESVQAGEIKLNGAVINQAATNWPLVRQEIGMVFQNYELFPHLTVMENILLGPLKAQRRKKAEAAAQAEKLLNRVGLIDKRAAYPRELSGGQKQRVAIVRALCMNPQIMLFDEVTASLDPEMVKEVLDVMRELAGDGMTMLIVTHELAFAKAVADKIVFVDAGNVLESSAPEVFFHQPQTVRAQHFLNRFKSYA